MTRNLRAFALRALAIGGFLFAGSAAHAQQPSMQYFRPGDQQGLNTFETTKNDTTPFHGLRVRFGGAFTQDYQTLTASNTAAYLPYDLKATPKADSTNYNVLEKLTNGFNLAEANLSLDGQLDDGIRVNLTMYLASRHHNESWVKNGYLQIDKASFMHLAALDDIMKSLTIKVGQLEVDYGDQHYRRVDGGNEMYNPFVENYIMDEFATEVGAEAYWHDQSGLFVMLGATSGMLNQTVVASDNPTSIKIDSATKQPNAYNPALHGKLGFDKQLTSDLRVRLTGSYYAVSSTASSTLFGGDRTGSHYFYVMESSDMSRPGRTATSYAFSGRFNPSFTDEVSTFMINPFVKFGGLELFGTYEAAKGRTIAEKDLRSASQIAGDLVFRFGSNENFWVGARYNQVSANIPVLNDATAKDYKNSPNSAYADVKINRVVGSAGWFLTPNVMMKAEYVTQKYVDFPTKDLRNGGKFDGMVVEAALGF